MNDLELMEKFRSDVPAPTPQALAEARAAMFRAQRPERRTRWVWKLAPAAALAVAVGVVGVVSLPGEKAGQPEQAVASDAVRVLRLAAAEALREPALKARPDQFLYFRSRVAYGSEEYDKNGKITKYNPPVEKERRIWSSVDGSRAGLVSEKDLGTLPTDAGFPAYRRDLPTDAKAMRAYLYKGTANDPKKRPADRLAFTKVGDTLREQYLTPASAAALFEAAATIPTAKKVSQVDLAGRKGIAVTRTEDHFQQQLIFDAKTYRFLGERTAVVGEVPGYPANAVTGWTAQLEIKVVDQAGQRP